jgi:hypothetical protein
MLFVKLSTGSGLHLPILHYFCPYREFHTLQVASSLSDVRNVISFLIAWPNPFMEDFIISGA